MRRFLLVAGCVLAVGCGEDDEPDKCRKYCDVACDKSLICGRLDVSADAEACSQECFDVTKRHANATNLSDSQRQDLCERNTEWIYTLSCGDFIVWIEGAQVHN